MIGRLFKTFALIGLLIALGCEVTDSLSSEPDFGDPYTIATAASPSTIAPRLDAHGLHVTLQYSGGCRTHSFYLQYQPQGDTTEIWLRHDGNRDQCEAYLSETRQFTVSSRALETANVVLLLPDGAAFPLR